MNGVDCKAVCREIDELDRDERAGVMILAHVKTCAQCRTFSTIVTPEDVRVLAPTQRPLLTLVTCYPFYFVGSAPKRFMVRLHRSDRGAAAPATGQQHAAEEIGDAALGGDERRRQHDRDAAQTRRRQPRSHRGAIRHLSRLVGEDRARPSAVEQPAL